MHDDYDAPRIDTMTALDLMELLGPAQGYIALTSANGPPDGRPRNDK